MRYKAADKGGCCNEGNELWEVDSGQKTVDGGEQGDGEAKWKCRSYCIFSLPRDEDTILVELFVCLSALTL